MRRTGLLLLCCICSAPASAQVVTLADIKGKGAAQLSAEELKQLMPGARVISRTHAGSTRRWENETDGTLVASSDVIGKGSGRAHPASGQGSWRVTDQGTYCVSIDWRRAPEQWCRHIFKAVGKYYGVTKLEDPAPAQEFEISK